MISTNHVGDFGLLLGILGFYYITGSFEFQDLFEIFNDIVILGQIASLVGEIICQYNKSKYYWSEFFQRGLVDFL